MKRIAITGNIACGKSEAFKIIKESGFSITDCDDIVNSLYEDNFVIQLLSANFPEVITDNKIDKQKLSKLIINSDYLKTRLELIIHPLVRNEIKNFFELHKNEDKVFVNIPLLFEANMEKLFDIKVMISSDKEIRTQRLSARNTTLSNYAKQIIDMQMSDAEKEKLCDYVIKNNGTLEEFQNAVKEFIFSL